MPARHFDLISHWRIQAPVDHVWAALTDPESWPRWWPALCEVQTLRPGGTDDLGSLRRLTWATPWPARLMLEVESVEAVHLQRLRGRCQGLLSGEGVCLLRPQGQGADAETHVTSVWRVRPAPRGLYWCAPALEPLLRWRHRAVMQAGGEGLNALLQRRAASASPMARR